MVMAGEKNYEKPLKSSILIDWWFERGGNLVDILPSSIKL